MSLDVAAKLAAVAKEEDLSPTQLAYSWARGREYMGSVIIGCTTLAQLEENIRAFETPLLTADQEAKVDAACDESFGAYYSRLGEVKRVVA